MLKEKGQSTAEILVIAMVILALLVIVVGTVNQRNAETLSLSEAAENTIVCSAISEAVSSLYINRGRSETTLVIGKEAGIKRQGTSPGTIYVGGQSCNYVGIIKDDNTGTAIALNESTNYKFWKDNGEVNICEMPC